MKWLLTALLAIPIGAIIRMALGTFGVILLPKILKYFYMNYTDEIFQYVLSQLSELGFSYDGIVIQMTGFAGYLAEKFHFIDCLAVVISSTITIFFLSFFRK